MTFAALIVLLIVLFAVNLLLGSIYIPPDQVLDLLFGHADEHSTGYIIILQSRLPGAITAALSGAALGVGGLMMQTLFRNPLADPAILGISSGASLGVAIYMLLLPLPSGTLAAVHQVTGSLGVVGAAFLGSFAVLLLIALLTVRFNSNLHVLISGVMISFALGALVGILQFYSLKEDLQAFVIWGLGSFNNVPLRMTGPFSSLILVGLLLAVLLIKPLNLIMLGDHYATNLGLNTRLARIMIIITTGLLVATVTAYCGPIAFLGLAIPHLIRYLFNHSDHLIVLPGTIVGGASLALLSHLIARLPGLDSALPVNTITSLIGAPLVIWMIIRPANLKKLS